MASFNAISLGRYRSFRKMCRNLIPALLFLGLYGCAVVGPDYTKPEVDLPDSWNAKLKNGLHADSVSPATLAQWWKTFKDPMLTELMARVVRGNLDLQSAKARVLEARARRGISKAARLPQIDGKGVYTNRRNRADDTEYEIDPGLPGIPPFTTKLNPERNSELYTAGFDAGWEIDLFGGLKRTVEAADADLDASHEEYKSVLVSLLAETALNYVEIRTLQKRIEVAKANVEAQLGTYEISRSRYKAGLSDEYSVEGARAALSGTRAQIPVLQAALESGMNRLAVLTGEAPGQLHQRLSIKAEVPVPPDNVAVGVPADTLRNRPDVRKAERLLAAQTARIGVAKSELYPKLSLFGTLGYESSGSDDLFKSNNLTSSFGPKLSWGIFRGGAVLRNIEVQSALQKQTLENYKSTVLSALEEAENALADYVWEKARRAELVIANNSARVAFRLARNEYSAGLADFNKVLLAQKEMLSYEDQLALSEGKVTTNLVRLYKSLGGGWTTQMDVLSDASRNSER